MIFVSFERKLRERKPRKTPISWVDLIGNILDQYRQYVDDLAHPVQKDAIQNSWDARAEIDDWRMVFKLMKDSKGKVMLTIEDHGTTGLTGRILPEGEYDQDLPEEERWGRFQGLAFRRENPKALGARGQGKLVFVGSSETGTIIYDTVRKDGVYRLGVRRLGDLWEREGEEAVELLRAYSADLVPLSGVGARIIIDEPIAEVKQALRHKKLLRYIQTTWWPLLKEYQTEIYVQAYSKRWKVVYPSDLTFPDRDSKEIKVWIKDWIPIQRARKRARMRGFKGLQIKKLRMCWSKEPVAEDIRGIAVIRGGMVVERIPVSDLLSGAEPALMEHIYGYVEGDMGVQLKLKLIEDPTHYRFRKRTSWGHKNIFGLIKEYVSGQLQIFADEKLGLKKGVRETEDVAAIRNFNRIMKALRISVFSPVLPSTSGGGGTSSEKDFVLKLLPPDFPNPDRRVDYGDEISNIRLEIINKTQVPADLMVKIYTEQEWVIRDTILDKVYHHVKSSFNLLGGPFRLTIAMGKYVEGQCHLRGSLVCLKHPAYEKGQELDKKAHIFWIAQEPPPKGKGPFREIERRPNLMDEIGSRSVIADSKVVPHPKGGYSLVVNLGHQLYKKRCPTKDDEQDYIIELMAKNLPHVLVANNHELFKGIDDPDEIIRRSSLIQSQIMDKYYSTIRKAA